MRVRYAPALAITGQMYGPWRYLQRQLSGNYTPPVPEEATSEIVKVNPGVEKAGETQVRIYPNPVAETLLIDSGNVAIRAVQLLNASGQAVYESQKFRKNVNVSKLADGVYILVLKKADGTQSSHRILVKK